MYYEIFQLALDFVKIRILIFVFLDENDNEFGEGEGTCKETMHYKLFFRII